VFPQKAAGLYTGNFNQPNQLISSLILLSAATQYLVSIYIGI
jgi:hypothetical protein